MSDKKDIVMMCGNCVYFENIACGAGKCKRHSPGSNGFPHLGDGMWCGDWKANPSKLLEIEKE